MISQSLCAKASRVSASMEKSIDLSEEIKVDGKVAHDVDIVIDRIMLEPEEITALPKRLLQR